MQLVPFAFLLAFLLANELLLFFSPLFHDLHELFAIELRIFQILLVLLMFL